MWEIRKMHRIGTFHSSEKSTKSMEDVSNLGYTLFLGKYDDNLQRHDKIIFKRKILNSRFKSVACERSWT